MIDMNICFVVPALVNKAPVALMLSLAEYLNTNGARVVFLYFDERVELVIPAGITTQRVSLRERYDFSGFDIVHSSLIRPDLFVALNRRKRNAAAFFTTVHSYIKEDLAFNYNWLTSRCVSSVWKLLWLRQDRVVVLSNHARQYYRSLLLGKKLRVVYNGRDVVRDGTLLPSEALAEVRAFRAKSEIVLGSYCVITAQKGLDLLIGALARDARLGLVVVGDGQEKTNLVKLAASLGVTEQCLFVPATPHAHQYNKFFDLFAMPSRAEGFGLALIEAALHRKKIICSDIPIFRELFDDACVTYFDLDDERSLDAAINVALNNEQKPLNAYAKASVAYSKEKMAASYELLYSELIATKKNS